MENNHGDTEKRRARKRRAGRWRERGSAEGSWERKGAVKRRMKTTTETQRTQRIAELKRGGEYRAFFLLFFSVFSVSLW